MQIDPHVVLDRDAGVVHCAVTVGVGVQRTHHARKVGGRAIRAKCLDDDLRVGMGGMDPGSPVGEEGAHAIHQSRCAHPAAHPRSQMRLPYNKCELVQNRTKPLQVSMGGQDRLSTTGHGHDNGTTVGL